MNAYDTNSDGVISASDNIDQAHVDNINALCDYNGNGEADICEIHDCINVIENDWRAQNCPGFPQI